MHIEIKQSICMVSTVPQKVASYRLLYCGKHKNDTCSDSDAISIRLFGFWIITITGLRAHLMDYKKANKIYVSSIEVGDVHSMCKPLEGM